MKILGIFVASYQGDRPVAPTLVGAIFFLVQSIFFTLLFFCTTTIHAKNISSPLIAIFTLEKNNPDKTYTATITLQNHLPYAITHWQLGLNTIRSLTHVEGAIIAEQIGEYFLIKPTVSSLFTIPSGGSIMLHVQGKHAIKMDSDVPSGYFLVVTSLHNKRDTIIDMQAINQLPPWKSAVDEEGEYAHNVQKNKTSVEGNAVASSTPVEKSLIVPMPVALERFAGKFVLQPQTNLQVNDSLAMPAAIFFKDNIAPATGFTLNINHQNAKNTMIENNIIFAHDNTEANEGYRLEATPHQIVIRANTAAGFFYAIQSLRQLLPPPIFSSHQQKNIEWSIPIVKIHDYPRFAYRGLLLDSARHFIPVNQVKRLLDLMAMHKLNMFQWHLTDDEGWRIEIKQYPTLTRIGAWRGYGLANPPLYSTGGHRYGGFYSQQDIRDVVQYAKERHITIIPEIDLPAHSRALMQSLPKKFIDTSDTSHYGSPQGYHDNVISPCLDSTYVVLNHIFAEIAPLFPSDVIHVGADEVPAGAWSQSTLCVSKGLHDPQQVRRYFFNRLEKIIHAHHKKMAGWEEILQASDVDTSTMVYGWKGEQGGVDAAKKGHVVVMMPAEYLYFDLAYNHHPEEPGQDWAGYVDTFKTYSYQPISPFMEKEVVKKIIGIQGALWSERFISPERLDYMAFPRVAALAEVAWTPANRRNWINFSERLGAYHLKRLDDAGVLYRISPPGVGMSAAGALDINEEFPGLIMRYTLDGTDPTAQSVAYRANAKIDSRVKVRAFNSLNDRGSSITSAH